MHLVQLRFPVVLAAVSLVLGQTGTAQSIQVPAGTATIDGRVEDAEWRNALRMEHPTGTVVRLLREGSNLFLGITSERPGFASLCVTQNEDVHVLHASAALGAITYRRSGDAWQSADTAFRYGMRNTALDDEARAQRAAYLNEHGWVGSTVRMSDGRSQEMQLSLTRFTPPLKLALGRWLFSNAVELWPASLDASDGCATQRLVNGWVPQGLRFNSAGWLTIDR